MKSEKEQKIQKAVDAAREFIRRANALTTEDKQFFGIAGTSRSGALRRQSMELTRALAEMRKGR